MTFLKEWKKLLICIGLFLLLFALQYFTGVDFSGPIKSVLDFIMTLLGIGALRYSILSRSEREAIDKTVKKNKNTEDEIKGELSDDHISLM